MTNDNATMTGEDLGTKLLESVCEMKAGKVAAVHHVQVSSVLEARLRTNLSQARFAALLGVSSHTLQKWEQGRCTPHGAAQSLIKIAAQRPDVLREVLG